MELNGGLQNWAHLVQLVNTRLELTDTPLADLALLRCEGSVDDYYKQFMALSCCDPSITEGHQIQQFTSGPGKPLRTDVTLQRLVSLDEAIMFARAYKQRNAPPSLPAPAPPSARSSSRQYTRALSAPTPSNPANSAGSSAGSVNKAVSTLKLTPTAIAEQCKIGQCFHYNDMYTNGHQEVFKQLFVIEVLIDEDDLAPTAETEDLTISLHALTGIRPRMGRTMQLAIDINGTHFNALLDSGSIHNCGFRSSGVHGHHLGWPGRASSSRRQWWLRPQSRLLSEHEDDHQQ
jgi:hypothetical protein